MAEGVMTEKGLMFTTDGTKGERFAVLPFDPNLLKFRGCGSSSPPLPEMETRHYEDDEKNRWVFYPYDGSWIKYESA